MNIITSHSLSHKKRRKYIYNELLLNELFIIYIGNYMNIKNFLKKYRITFIYGISMIPSTRLNPLITRIFLDIENAYSYKNQLIAIELVFLLLSLILIFSLYRYYKKKYKIILIGINVLNMILFSYIVLNAIFKLSGDYQTILSYTSYQMLPIYWVIHLISWGFYQIQNKR